MAAMKLNNDEVEMENMKCRFAEKFQANGSALACGIAPGRIEILGNHTDYNDGFVLSAAVQLRCFVFSNVSFVPVDQVSATPSLSPIVVRVYSKSFPNQGMLKVQLSDILDVTQNFDDTVVMREGQSEPGSGRDAGYLKYVFGVIRMLNQYWISRNEMTVEARLHACAGGNAVSGQQLSLNMYIESEVPVGAAVSSSAAVEVATAKSFLTLVQAAPIEKLDLVLLCKKAENEYVGMGCGMLDQFSSAMGKNNAVIFLDCRHPIAALENIEFPGMSFVLANTGAKHALVDGQYDKLKSWCYRARDIIKDSNCVDDVKNGQVISQLDNRSYPFHLRDVAVEDWHISLGDMVRNLSDQDTFNRGKHIVTENDRVLRAKRVLTEAMCGIEESSTESQTRDGSISVAAIDSALSQFGQLMSESHASSRDDFQNSCVELDDMQAFAQQDRENCYGSRLMGGGFGGCTINLVRKGKEEEFISTLQQKWEMKYGKTPSVLQVWPGEGAEGRFV